MNITNETRRESYIDIQPKRPIRYELILDRMDKPKTAKEIAVDLYMAGIIPSEERNYVAPRLTELEKRGIVKTIGKKKCSWSKVLKIIKSKNQNNITITTKENMRI